MEVPRLGPKAFEQAAGFLRIRGGDNPLDASAVHPEAYPVAQKMLTDLNEPIKEVMQKPHLLKAVNAEKYVDGEDEVVDFECIINEVALLRNKWLGVMKGTESKNFMLGHIVRLRTAGMEDVQV